MYGSAEELIDGFRELSIEEMSKAESLLEEASTIIDSYNVNKSEKIKSVVAIRMVRRVIGDGNGYNIYPIGATQGSMSANGYVQSWTASAGGGSGELYISKQEKRMLGIGNKIGCSNPFGGDSNV